MVSRRAVNGRPVPANDRGTVAGTRCPATRLWWSRR